MAKIADDKYYTPKPVVKAVLKVVEKELMPLEKFSRIIEPSAGAGAFLRELPKGAIGYDILPEYEGVIKGDYLKQDIPYLKNSLVVGNPPFGDGKSFLYKKFITESLNHSDFVAFVLHGNLYKKQPKEEGVILYKSFMLPEASYSGTDLKCCFNIYKRGNVKTKKIKDVKIYEFCRDKDDDFHKKKQIEFEKIKFDFRVCKYGYLKILKEEKTKVKEMKITFEKKVNFGPVLSNFLQKKQKTCISVGVVTTQEIIDLIYDTYEDLRAN